MFYNNKVDTIILLSAIVGIIVGIFIITDRIITVERTQRPVLDFLIGISPVVSQKSEPLINVGKNSYKISTLFFGTNIENNCQWSIGCPYLLINNSKLPIKNITVVLEYASKYFLQNSFEVKGIDGVMHFNKNYWNRDCQIYDSSVQVRYTVDILRPGEKIAILDPIKFEQESEQDKNLENFEYSGLLKELKKINNFKDFCVIDTYVFSESCPPISKRIKLLWFNAKTVDELMSLAQKTIPAFWGGKYPRGYYFRPYNFFKRKRRIATREYADLILPELASIKLSKEKRFYFWNDPNECDGVSIYMSLPTWNYYQLTGDFNTDELLKKHGFTKILLR